MDHTSENKPIARPKRVTIRDVAAAAGVSVGAASTALRNIKSTVVLSRETRERILRAAKDLRYRPNAAARAMAGRQLKHLGVLATEYCMMGSYYGSVLRGIANSIQSAGYHLMLKTVPHQMELQDASIFSEQLIDGVIIPLEAEERVCAALNYFSIPHVLLNTDHFTEHNCVNSDEMQGIRLAVEHLVMLGHRRIGYVPHPVEPVSTAIYREKAFVTTIRERGLELLPTYDRYMDVREHVDLYLAMPQRPTALVCYTDAVAILASHRLVERNVPIPQQMSVVGNEGIVLQYYASRRLTTVRAQTQQLGACAVRMLLEQIETGEPVKSMLLPQTLEILDSTAPPPATTA